SCLVFPYPSHEGPFPDFKINYFESINAQQGIRFSGAGSHVDRRAVAITGRRMIEAERKSFGDMHAIPW
ncbi:hypothetical protein, partial [Burkholderia ubonensis]|uniref:hypothetical protein n=1 Tax=Burkholderia ubonensis TaxID=101571 RepID=UPI001E412415